VEMVPTFALNNAHFFCETADVSRGFPSGAPAGAPSWEFVWNRWLAAPLREAGLPGHCPHLLQARARPAPARDRPGNNVPLQRAPERLLSASLKRQPHALGCKHSSCPLLPLLVSVQCAPADCLLCAGRAQQSWRPRLSWRRAHRAGRGGVAHAGRCGRAALCAGAARAAQPPAPRHALHRARAQRARVARQRDRVRAAGLDGGRRRGRRACRPYVRRP